MGVAVLCVTLVSILFFSVTILWWHCMAPRFFNLLGNFLGELSSGRESACPTADPKCASVICR